MYLKAVHGKSHIGTRKMEDFIFQNSVGIQRSEIRAYVSACSQCQIATPYTTLPPAKPIIENEKMNRLIVD
ncbi:hypothetical protein ENBRE01_2052 [Enteropsectra breve]|nr:hypothetical protein ENBRE01_2052 [Enteropsectra breve]